MAGFTFRLYLDNGDDSPGDFVTAVPNWEIGETFMTGDRRRWRILDIVEDVEELEYAGAFVVEPVAG
jgi:hypothetical protein